MTARFPDVAVKIDPASDGRTLLLGDWTPWVRDGIDVLRLAILAGAAVYTVALAAVRLHEKPSGRQVAGTLVGAAVIARKGAQEGRKTAVPFGPFLALGAVVALFAGDAMVDWYLATFA